MKQTLLAVMAHPDDETFGLGGTLALYASRGVEVHLVCATRGEVGSVSPEFLEDYSSIAELREHELLCAAEQLGLAEVYFLDYRDSGMVGTADNEHPQALAQADRAKVVETVVGFIRELKPQVVITFDPRGGYGHPDHIAIHDATVAAYHSAGSVDEFPGQGTPFQPQKLYYSTFSWRFVRPALALLRLVGRDPKRWGRNEDIDLTEMLALRYPTHAKVNYRKAAKRKSRATECHASQLEMGPSMSGPIAWLFRLNRFSAVDTFMRADPPVTNGHVERDLFEDVRLEALA